MAQHRSAALEGLAVIAIAFIGASARAEVLQPWTAQRPDVQVYEFDTASSRLEIHAAGALKTTDMQETNQGVSVRNARRDLPAVAGLSNRELLLVNGGRSGSSTDRPNGLLKSEGRLASWLNMQSIPGDPASSCPLRKVARPLLSGLLCVEQSGKASVRKIVDRTPPSVDACTSALQAGPMVVEQARAAVCDRDATAENANYSVICSLDESRLAVVVTRKPIALDDLAVWLAKPKTPDGTGGAGCRDAMVLNAGGAAGTMHARSQSYQLDGRKPIFSGPGSWPVASFLFVTPRTPEPAIPPPPRAINNAAKSVTNVN